MIDSSGPRSGQSRHCVGELKKEIRDTLGTRIAFLWPGLVLFLLDKL